MDRMGTITPNGRTVVGSCPRKATYAVDAATNPGKEEDFLIAYAKRVDLLVCAGRSTLAQRGAGCLVASRLNYRAERQRTYWVCAGKHASLRDLNYTNAQVRSLSGWAQCRSESRVQGDLECIVSPAVNGVIGDAIAPFPYRIAGMLACVHKTRTYLRDARDGTRTNGLRKWVFLYRYRVCGSKE